MTPTTVGWLLFIGALGEMAALMAPEVGKLTTWGAAFAPGFVAIIMVHFSSVALAFVGGKIIPAARNGRRTRASDPPAPPAPPSPSSP